MTTNKTIEIPECSMCKDYQEVQDIKTKRIKELKKQLEIAKEALKFYKKHVNSSGSSARVMCDELFLDDGDRAREALGQIGEVE